MNWFKVLLVLELSFLLFSLYKVTTIEKCKVLGHVTENSGDVYKGTLNLNCETKCEEFELYGNYDNLKDLQNYMTDLYPIGSYLPTAKTMQILAATQVILIAITVVISDL